MSALKQVASATIQHASDNGRGNDLHRIAFQALIKAITDRSSFTRDQLQALAEGLERGIREAEEAHPRCRRCGGFRDDTIHRAGAPGQHWYV